MGAEKTQKQNPKKKERFFGQSKTWLRIDV